MSAGGRAERKRRGRAGTGSRAHRKSRTKAADPEARSGRRAPVRRPSAARTRLDPAKHPQFAHIGRASEHRVRPFRHGGVHVGRSGTHLYVVRHGRSSGNFRHIMTGSRMDVPLTGLGRAQARELARRWKRKPDVILSSPLRRARHTATPLARRFDLDIVIVPEAIEQDCGEWTGRTSDELMREHPHLFCRDGRGKPTRLVDLGHAPGAESWAAIVHRARRVLARIARDHPGRHVVLATHAGFALACLSVLTGKRRPALFDHRFKNAQTVKFVL